MLSAVFALNPPWAAVGIRGDAVRAQDDPLADLAKSAENGAEATFDAIYDEHFDFVWRSVRRLGVADSQVDDAVQDVFLVVHRRLGDFQGRSSVRTWLFGIALRVARTHRRRAARKGTEPLTHEVADQRSLNPHEVTARNEAIELLHRLLDELDDDKRAVFVLAELEQMTAPEIGEALGVKLNTVYSRLRAARKHFDEALKRHRARTSTRTGA